MPFPSCLSSQVSTLLIASSFFLLFYLRAGPRGLLTALTKVSTQQRPQLVDSCATLSASVKQALQDLILDGILVKMDATTLTAADKAVLKALPVWRRRTKGSSVFCSLDETSPLVCLPPMGVPDELLDESFLLLRSEKDRELYALLEVKQISQAAFYMQHVLPKVKSKTLEAFGGKTKEEILHMVATELMVNLARFEEQQPGLRLSLQDCPMVRNQKGQFLAPSELYDPQDRTLTSVLPPELFPHADLVSHLHSLRQLGLRVELDPEGVLQAAMAIQADPATMVTTSLTKAEVLRVALFLEL